jgi:hypothetical protein
VKKRLEGLKVERFEGSGEAGEPRNGHPYPGCFVERVWKMLEGKEIGNRGVQKSAKKSAGLTSFCVREGGSEVCAVAKRTEKTADSSREKRAMGRRSSPRRRRGDSE